MSYSFVDNYFPDVVAGKKNSEVFESCLKISLFREQVVDCLMRIEKEDLGHAWWDDGELMKIFITLYKDGVISLPADPIDRLRWIALLCIEASKKERFSWGNVLVPMDYLDDDDFKLFEHEYPTSVFVEILKVRERLSQVGWEMIFGR